MGISTDFSAFDLLGEEIKSTQILKFGTNVMMSSSRCRVGTSSTTIVRSLIGGRRRRLLLSSVAAASSSPSPQSHLRSIISRQTSPYYNYNHALTQTRSILLFGHDNNGDDQQQQFDKRRPWHNPTFMKDSPPEQVEAWLLSLLKSVSNNNIHNTDNRDYYSPQTPPVSLFDRDDKFILDSTAYLRVLEAYANSSAKNYSGAPQKAEYWLNNAIRHYHAAVALFESKYRTKFDSELLQQLQQQSSEQLTEQQRRAADAATIVHSLQPGVECYNAVIQAWGSSKEKVSVVRSRTWLSKLEDDDNSTPLIQPNARSYDSYLHSVSRGIGKNAKLHLERAEEAENILQYRLSSSSSSSSSSSTDNAPTSIRPTTESFNYVLRAYTRCRKEGSITGKVMTLVREMEQIQKEAVLNHHVKRGEGDDHDWKMNVIPNTKTYTMAMDAWIIKAGIKADKFRLEQLARKNMLKQKGIVDNETDDDNGSSTNAQDVDGTKEMEFAKSILTYISALQQVGQGDVRASVVGYNTLLSGYAKLASELRPDIPLIAEQLLNEMIDASEDSNTYPDVTSFNAVIKAWGKTKRKNSAARCEYWLRKMINENRSKGRNYDDQQATPIAHPDSSTYNLVMEAWLQMDDPDATRVQDLLLEMKASDVVAPDSESYSKVIRAWLKDELLNQHVGVQGSSVERAWAWLDELMALEEHGDVGPAPELFTSILKTAAWSEGRTENLLAVAQASFWAKRNRSRFNVDSIDFVFLQKIGMKVLAGQERDNFMVDLMRQCSKDGLVSKRLVREAAKGPIHEEWPEEERERIIQLLFCEEDNFFPSSCSRNVHKHDRPSAKDLVMS